MKSIKTLVAVTVAACGMLAMADVYGARGGGGGGGGGHGGGGHGGGGGYRGGHGHGGHGGHGHGGHYHGGYYGWGWGAWYGAAWVLGAPYYWGYPYYWGAPYYADAYYAPPQVVYREVPSDYTQPVPGAIVPDERAPARGPAYMNYCPSAKAYYPKVTNCPEGWQFITPQ